MEILLPPLFMAWGGREPERGRIWTSLEYIRIRQRRRIPAQSEN